METMSENQVDELLNKIQQLEKENKKLKSRKKYGLVWDEKKEPEQIVLECKEKIPVLTEIKERKIIEGNRKPTNILIEGDNYHALQVLNYTHRGKIDVIYIDPPYNTGNDTWKYNNKYLDEDDPFIHSKWISFMDKRLKLAKNLLSDDGVICVTIDNYEIHNLRHLMEEIFQDRDLIITVIEHNYRGRAKNNFALTHEYAIWGVPKGKDAITKLKKRSDDIKRNLRRTGQGSRRHESPTLFYGIEVNMETLEIISVTEPIPEDESLPKTGNEETKYIFPIDREGIEKRWYYSPSKAREEIEEGNIWAKRIRDRIEIHYWKPGKRKRRKSVWTGSKYDGSTFGSELLTEIIGENNFPYPKSLYAVKECIEAASEKKDAIILDFFAGSGTTAHAVHLMNNEDDGERKYILCTNNELAKKEAEKLIEDGLQPGDEEYEKEGICQKICYPRTKNVIEGYEFNGKEREVIWEKKIGVHELKKGTDIYEESEEIKQQEKGKDPNCEIIRSMSKKRGYLQLIKKKEIDGRKEGLGGKLRYFKTDFIDVENVYRITDKKKIELTYKAGEMIAIREDVFEEIEKNQWWQIFKNKKKTVAIYFREDQSQLEELLEKIKGENAILYLFSWGKNELKAEQYGYENIQVKDIPQPIIEVYKEVNRLTEV